MGLRRVPGDWFVSGHWRVATEAPGGLDLFVKTVAPPVVETAEDSWGVAPGALSIRPSGVSRLELRDGVEKGVTMELFCGIDWAEHHHDVALVNAGGDVLATFRISDDPAGFARLVSRIGRHTMVLGSVGVALETDRGLLVAALREIGVQVFSINPKSVDRYRDRFAVSGAKSDAGDALVLAHLLRTDARQHRQIANDSQQVLALSALSRAHQDAVRTRLRDAGRLRSHLREYYPAALTAFPCLTTRTALGVLWEAPTPMAARQLSADDLRRLGRMAGRVSMPATVVNRLLTVFAEPQLRHPPAVEEAMGAATRTILATLRATEEAVQRAEDELVEAFARHPQAGIVASLPGVGPILGARLISEFGDDKTRYVNAAARRRYAGVAPVTRASGKSRVVLMRRARNDRLFDTCRMWAFNAIGKSAGADAYYRARRAKGEHHEAALRRLGSKLLGQLHHCLEDVIPYSEELAWAPTP
ncbi:IS110 family transposase [Intrasporangium calvum]